MPRSCVRCASATAWFIEAGRFRASRPRVPDILPCGNEIGWAKSWGESRVSPLQPTQARRAPRSSQPLLREGHPIHPSLPDLRPKGLSPPR